MRGFFIFLWCAVAHAQTAVNNEALELRMRQLETELRCLVCQNQTLADSPSGLAADLRREMRGQALLGKNDDEIKQYLQTRYGDFVLYKPPVKSTTWLLWFGPFALLLLGVVVMVMMARRRKHIAPVAALSEDEQVRAEALLK